MQTEKDSPQSGPPDLAKQPSGAGPKVFDEALKKEGAIDSLLESSRRFAPEI